LAPVRLSLRQLLAYGGLGLPLAALGLPLVVYLPPFYAGLGLGTATVGAMLFIARLSNIFSDLLIGWASDRTRSRLGRRRPWILAGAPVLLVGAGFLFHAQAGAGAGYLLLWSVVAYLGWTLIYLPYSSWGAELATDYDERTRVTLSREGFLVAGTLVAILLPGWVQARGGSAGDALSAVYGFLLVSLPLALLLLWYGVPEPRGLRTAPLGWRAGLRLLRDNRPFRRLLIAYLLNGMANGLPATLFLFFVAEVLQSGRLGGLFLVVYFLSAVLALPLWLRVSRGRAKHRVWCISMLWASGVFVWVPWLGPGDVWAYAAICVLSGVCLGVDTAVPASIQADVIDEDTASGGGYRAGLYFGLWGMATKLALALAVGVALPLLQWAGFSAEGPNDRGALLALALLYGGLPVAIKLGVVVLVWDFPLDRHRHAELRVRIGGMGPAQGSRHATSSGDLSGGHP
jgi:glycoside/pentoside/hexuronide:cation symporter, GPH family